MASVGSLPFTAESSVILYSVNHRRPRFPFFAYRPRKPLDSAGNNGLSFRYSKAVREDYNGFSLSCDRLIGGWRIMIPKVEAKGFVEGEDDSNEVEDALQATINKSKKVLALQKDLLQQVFPFLFFK
jgi:starch synthase